jgi:hypothetical protein
VVCVSSGGGGKQMWLCCAAGGISLWVVATLVKTNPHRLSFIPDFVGRYWCI